MSALVQRYRTPYPSQFWLMFWGMLISTVGASMIWPFLMIYVSERLALPLTIAASLLTINSFVILVSSFLAGPFIDRFGRKWMMVASLFINGLYFLLLGQADSYLAFAALMVLGGIVNPVYRVGADAMMADLVPPEKRADAYSLLRLSNNIGIAIGPAIGGMIASTSYSLSFIFAAAGMILYSLLLLVRARETLPAQPAGPVQQAPHEALGGYPAVLRDRRLMQVVANFALVTICAATIWILMPVYAKQNFGVPESLYGLIPTTNALLVVFLQIPVTQFTKRRAALLMMSLGAAFYSFAAGGVAFAQNFTGFWVCMIVMTVGELIIVPTSSTYVANLAPADKRGRYMSIYGLSWGIATGLGSLLGGILNDTFGPRAIWYGAFAAGMLATLSLLYLSRQPESAAPAPDAESATPLPGEPAP